MSQPHGDVPKTTITVTALPWEPCWVALCGVILLYHSTNESVSPVSTALKHGSPDWSWDWSACIAFLITFIIGLGGVRFLESRTLTLKIPVP